MTAPEDQAPEFEAQDETHAAAQEFASAIAGPASPVAAFEPGAAKAVLLTTTSGDEGAVANLERMLDGLRAQARSGANFVSLILVQQDEAATEALRVRLNPPAHVELVPGGGRMSLSAARNALLTIVAERGLVASDDVVAYPDDDSWYPEGFLSSVQYLFANDPFFDFFFCRYGEQTEECHLSRLNEAPSTQCVVSNASSNTIFVRGRLANLMGGFDEKLGVGAEHKSGEDLDYALRAYHRAVQRGYLSAQLVGHRDKNPGIRAKYYRGSLLVLSRYAMKSAGAMTALLRKLAVGGMFILTRRLRMREFAASIWLAAEELGRGEKSS